MLRFQLPMAGEHDVATLFGQHCMVVTQGESITHFGVEQASHVVPGGAAGHYLLGRICRLSGRQKEAEGHFAAALTLDPLLWCAFEELCMLGEPRNASTEGSASAGLSRRNNLKLLHFFPGPAMSHHAAHIW